MGNTEPARQRAAAMKTEMSMAAEESQQRKEKWKSKEKRYEQLTFTDDFMFCKVMEQNPVLCREVTELILGRKIGWFVLSKKQKEIEITADGRGVRFDVYLEDDTDTIYDIEMQAASFKEIPTADEILSGNDRS